MADNNMLLLGGAVVLGVGAFFVLPQMLQGQEPPPELPPGPAVPEIEAGEANAIALNRAERYARGETARGRFTEVNGVTTQKFVDGQPPGLPDESWLALLRELRGDERLWWVEVELLIPPMGIGPAEAAYLLIAVDDSNGRIPWWGVESYRGQII